MFYCSAPESYESKTACWDQEVQPLFIFDASAFHCHVTLTGNRNTV